MTKLSLRAAINAKCKECIHDPYGGMGQWRESVEQCSSSNCPLHPVRPRSTSQRIEKPVSSPENAQPAPDPADDAETDVSALLGGLFGPHA
jgi:hypothetical protein